jgi:hypothetical protein
MEKRPKVEKKKRRGLRLSIQIIVVLLVVGIVVLLVAAPKILESYMRTGAARLGLDLRRGNVRSLGTSGIDLADVTLGDDAHPDLFIPFLSLDYSPFGILKGRIREARLSGMKLQLDIGEDGLHLRGLEPLLRSDSQGAAPFSFNRLEIFSSELLLSWQGRRLSIPFEGTITRMAGQGSANRYRLAVTLKPWGQPVNLRGQLDLDNGSGGLKIQARSFGLHNLLETLGVLPDIFFRGGIDLQAEVQLAAWQVEGAEVTLAAPDFRMLGRDVEAAAEWQLKFGISPEFTPRGIELLATIHSLYLAGQEIPGPLNLRLNGPGLSRLDAACTLAPQSLSALLPGLGASGPYRLMGEVKLSAEGNRHRLTAAASLRLARVQLPLGEFVFKARQIFLSSNVDYDFAKKFRAHGRVTVKSGSLEGGDLKIKNIELNLPWTWPREAKAPGPARGKLTAAALEIGGLHLHDISADIEQQESTLTFSGSAATPLEPLTVSFSGVFRLEDQEAQGAAFRVKFETPESRLEARTPLKKLHKALAGLNASGRLTYAGEITLSGGVINSRARVKVGDFDVDMPASKLSITGIDGELKFRDLIALVSEPAQKLTFRQLEAGAFRVSDGELKVAFESSDTIFLERGTFRWLKGKVLVNPVRFRPETPEVELSLYCDRIDFDELINLIVGKPIASGDAEINGIVPLRIDRGYPQFQEGYLYSTPGIEGVLAVRESHLISGGVALVEEALKDFRYDWVRVKLIPRGENLDMTVLIKGVPGQKLALSYDGKKKDFVRSRSGERRVDLKGLVLELRLVDIDLKGLLKGSGRLLFLNKSKSNKE